jgi:hypothetical protein
MGASHVGWLVCAAVATGCGRVGFDVEASGYSGVILGDGPLAYWRLNETSGTVAHDELGNYPGTFQGNCTLGVAGALSDGEPAVAFDGSSCSIVVGAVLPFDGTAAFSLEVWANITLSNGSVRWLISNNTGNPKTGYSLSIVDTTLWFEQDASGASTSYVATGLPSLDVFHHLVVTTNAKRQRIYVDGALAVETGFAVVQPSSPGALAFGVYVPTDPNQFAGTLDEIAFYDRELDPTVIAAHFAAR